MWEQGLMPITIAGNYCTSYPTFIFLRRAQSNIRVHGKPRCVSAL